MTNTETAQRGFTRRAGVVVAGPQRLARHRRSSGCGAREHLDHNLKPRLAGGAAGPDSPP